MQLSESHLLLLRLATGFVVVCAGWLGARFLGRMVTRALLSRPDADPTLAPFLGQLLRFSLIAIAATVALSTAGVDLTSVVAFMGAAGVAVGLAVQGLLSNLTAGVALLTFRPFRVGETIEAAGVVGEVAQIGMLMTDVVTADRLHVAIPNGKLWGNEIRNHTREEMRRVELPFMAPLWADLTALTPALVAKLTEVPGVSREHTVDVVVTGIVDVGVQARARVWCRSNDIRGVRDRAGSALQSALVAEGLWQPPAHP